MAKKKNEKIALALASKSVPPVPWLSEEVTRLSDASCPLSDKELVILGLAHLDMALEAALMYSFGAIGKPNREALFGGPAGQSAVLSTYHSKLHVSKAMGLLSDDAFSDLGLMQALRNAFAHSVNDFGLAHELVRPLIENLLTVDVSAEHDFLKRRHDIYRDISTFDGATQRPMLLIAVGESMLLHVPAPLRPSLGHLPGSVEGLRQRFITNLQARWFFLMATGVLQLSHDQNPGWPIPGHPVAGPAASA